MQTILLAGATGYLGKYLLCALLEKGYAVKAVVRNEKKLPSSIIGHENLEIIQAEVTVPSTLKGHFKDVDTVISTVGITKQKEGLTYMDVDYQANINLLKEARQNEVKRFMYISVFKGAQFKKLKICAAKEKFVAALKDSDLEYCIIRPTGFYSDIGEFLNMAKNGRAFIIGKGNYQMNPIHGADLAEYCINALTFDKNELPVGGPECFTTREMANLAFTVLNKTPKLITLPEWALKIMLFLLRTFFSRKFYGPIEFLMTVLSHDMVAPAYGKHRLKAYFEAHK